MAEMKEYPGKKVIAAYLPQFHTIPENDQWWGKGFTEWTNTKKAKPLFDGHYQPRTPLNENYYCLEDVTVMEKQAELAKKYGIFGFCYYHYWFKNGKKLLEMPVENMLKDKKVDIPFCLCWANEHWTRNWDGGNKEIIAEQDYGTKNDWEQHFQYFLEFFKDERYITYDGKPLLILYKPEIIPALNYMIQYWKKRMKQEGFPGLIVIRQLPVTYYRNLYDDSNIDYTIKFEPIAAWTFDGIANGLNPVEKNRAKIVLQRKLKGLLYAKANGLFNLYHTSRVNKQNTDIDSNRGQELEIMDFDEKWDTILNKEPYNDTLINGAFTSWDNTARNLNGKVVHGSTPQKFEKYMTELLKKPSPMDMIFMNAWNEWAEGAYLEPDEKYGYAYLEALNHALTLTQEDL